MYYNTKRSTLMCFFITALVCVLCHDGHSEEVDVFHKGVITAFQGPVAVNVRLSRQPEKEVTVHLYQLVSARYILGHARFSEMVDKPVYIVPARAVDTEILNQFVDNINNTNQKVAIQGFLPFAPEAEMERVVPLPARPKDFDTIRPQPTEVIVGFSGVHDYLAASGLVALLHPHTENPRLLSIRVIEESTRRMGIGLWGDPVPDSESHE